MLFQLVYTNCPLKHNFPLFITCFPLPQRLPTGLLNLCFSASSSPQAWPPAHSSYNLDHRLLCSKIINGSFSSQIWMNSEFLLWYSWSSLSWSQWVYVLSLLNPNQLWSHWPHRWPFLSLSFLIYKRRDGDSITYMVISTERLSIHFSIDQRAEKFCLPCQVSDQQHISSSFQHNLRSFEEFCLHFKYMSIDVNWNLKAGWDLAQFCILAPLAASDMRYFCQKGLF